MDTEKLESPDIGGRLRALRRRYKLSLRALAKISGVSANTISLVERGRTSPSVATLHRLAIALDVPITAFFEEVAEQQVILVRANHQAGVGNRGTELRSLGSGLAEQQIEPFLLTLVGPGHSGKRPVVHLGQEFVFCLEGALEYEIDGRLYRLDAGDSLLFEAHLPHCWRNASSGQTKALLVFHSMGEEEKPVVQRHL